MSSGGGGGSDGGGDGGGGGGDGGDGGGGSPCRTTVAIWHVLNETKPAERGAWSW